MDSTTATTIVPVVDLIGKPVAGIRAQVRKRRDGQDWRPMWRTLISFELRHDKGNIDEGGTLPAQDWVYWTWEPDSRGRYDCGYSGMTLQLAREMNRCIEFEGNAP
jgi:hypothetical protein